MGPQAKKATIFKVTQGAAGQKPVNEKDADINKGEVLYKSFVRF